MAQVSKIMSFEHGLLSGAFREAGKCYCNKLVGLEIAVKTGKDSLFELCQKYQESIDLIRRLDTRNITLKGKLRDAQFKGE